MRRHIVACIIGNVLEWYEFSLLAYLSPLIATLFFPNENRIASLLAVLLVVAAGFVIRPLGSIVLGHLGDKYGRAQTLKLTILLLSISSILTGCLPTFSTAGTLAPVLLVLCRLLQGFCIGGEFAGSMIYLSEAAHPKRRALISSMTNNGSNTGVLLAILACTVFSFTFGEQALSAYGWRILFISGGIIGLTGLWLRRDLSESDTFKALRSKISYVEAPLRFVITHQRQHVIKITLLLFISACGSYTLMGYISTYLHEFLHLPLQQAYKIQTSFIVFSLLCVPCFAILADKIGRKSVLLFAIIGYLLCTFPSFYLLQWKANWWMLMPLVLCYSAEQAVLPVLMAEMYPGKGRFTGISMAYNLCMATVGGFSAAINTWLIHAFQNPMMIAYYVVVCALVSLVVTVKHCPNAFGIERNLQLV